MKIDKKVELAVREALAGSVAGERQRFDNAVVGIGRAGDDFASTALSMVLAIDALALHSIHDARRPSDLQLQRLAQEFAEQEGEWVDVDAATTLAFLTALADGKSPLDVLVFAKAFFAAFAVGGWLLSAFLPDDAEWTDYLDEILDRLEAEPA